MKKIILLLTLSLAPLVQMQAQVAAEVVLDQDHFLDGETLTASVKISNRSGQTLQFGADATWLAFSIESRDGFIVIKNSEPAVQGEFSLENGKVAIRRVDLTPHFALNRIGRYQIVATIKIKAWEAQISTKPKAFEIVHAAKIWSQEFGLRTKTGATNQPPEVRRYSLEQANYLRSQLRLYLRITGADENDVIKVVPIGGMVSISNPERQIDQEGRLHVLYQDAARSYNYSVIDPAGEILIRQTHDIARSRPRLSLDETGKVTVAGGTRRLAGSDLPALKTPEPDVAAENP